MDLNHVKTLCTENAMETGDFGGALPGLSLYQRPAPSVLEATVYEPVLCLILQGEKTTAVGEHTVRLGPGDALLVSHTLPVTSRITRASVQAPYTALILSLDLGLVRSLHDQMVCAPPDNATARPLAVGPAEPSWLDPLGRYIALSARPMDAQVLGPSVLREVHYRLLLSPLGRMLRHLLDTGSHASQVARALQKLRRDYAAPLSVPQLAAAAGMSGSSFHTHFKAVTGTTPLQYLKDLRLIEAHQLLTRRRMLVSETAYAVGYESPTHFSRDYNRKFGHPPREARLGLSGVATRATV